MATAKSKPKTPKGKGKLPFPGAKPFQKKGK